MASTHGSVSDDFSENLRLSLTGALKGFERDDRRAFSERQTVALGVKRATFGR